MSHEKKTLLKLSVFSQYLYYFPPLQGWKLKLGVCHCVQYIFNHSLSKCGHKHTGFPYSIQYK